MTDDRNDSLSSQGEARREAMLGELVREMSRFHRGRRIRRSVTSAAAVTLLLVGVFRYADFGTRQREIATNTPVQAPSLTLPPLKTDPILFVHTDPTICDRYRATPPSIIVLMDDAQLLNTLVEVGRPAGLIRFGERLALSAPVTDEELHVPQERR